MFFLLKLKCFNIIFVFVESLNVLILYIWGVNLYYE